MGKLEMGRFSTFKWGPTRIFVVKFTFEEIGNAWRKLADRITVARLKAEQLRKSKYDTNRNS